MSHDITRTAAHDRALLAVRTTVRQMEAANRRTMDFSFRSGETEHRSHPPIEREA